MLLILNRPLSMYKILVIYNLCFYFPYLHKGSIGIEKSPSEIFSEFRVSDYVDSEK